MLILKRRARESIVIGGAIEVVVLDVSKGGLVTLGVTAPRDIEIDRREVHESKQADRERGAR